MTRFHDLMRFAKTGIAHPDMTGYDKLKALALFPQSYPSTTVTGIPPLSFKANGQPLTSWSISGNSRQNGTPTPAVPIYPEFVGERTENLFDAEIEQGSFNGNTGAETSSTIRIRSAFSSQTDVGQYTISAVGVDDAVVYVYDTNNTSGFKRDESITIWTQLPVTFALTASRYVRFGFRKSDNSEILPSEISNVMLNTGSAPMPYEPYGYKIDITCAGQTTPIYIGDPLRKAIDGSDAVDILYSTGTITRAVDADGNALETPTTQIIDVLPEIQTVRGSNVLSFDTTVQPSSVTITGHIKQM